MLILLALITVTAKTVCIDPGHPSEIGRGTHGKHLTEIHANWVMAKELKSLLIQQGIRVVMTKHRELEEVTNARRAEIANTAEADLMIRLHCDGAPGSGFAVYFPDQAGRDGSFEGPSEIVRRSSQHAAEVIVADLGRVGLKNNGLKTDRATKVGREHGALVASIHSKVPVVLVEMATLTNTKDEAFMMSKGGRQKMATALMHGVLDALKALSR